MPIAGMGHVKPWMETVVELKDEFRKWGIDEYVLPTKSGSSDSVSVEYVMRGKWVEASCSHFTGEWDGPNKNPRAIFMAIHNGRLMDQRGIGDVLAQVASHLALPPGKDRPEYFDPHLVLGVTKDAPVDVVRAAYRARLKMVRPDLPDSDRGEVDRVIKAGKELGM